MTSPTVTIGAGATALVQAGNVIQTGTAGGGPAAISLPAPSTAGTYLLAVIAEGTSGSGPATVASMPIGWVQLLAKTQGTGLDLEFWAYPNNPGGISAVTFQGSGAAVWHAQLSEWSNVLSTVIPEAGGSATATAGTTLAVVTSGNVISTGDVAIAAWHQYTGVVGTVTFTTPMSWTRLADDSSTSQGSHLDVEFILNPPTGAPFGPTLTSTGTTSSAAGIVVVLRGGHPLADHTAYLRHDSVALKKNTADFSLIQGGHLQMEGVTGDQSAYLLEDGSGYYLLDTYLPQLGDPVAITNPSWTGRIVSVTNADVVDRLSNYRLVTIAATNSSVAAATSAPGDFSDVPTGGYLQLEDASGDLQLEDGSGNYELEGTSYGYRSLSVMTSQNQDGTVTTYGTLETFEAGFAAGQAILLTSVNLGYSAQSFSITNVTNTFVGNGTPAYVVEFGDAYQTLQLAGGGVLTKQGSQATTVAGTAMPGGTYGFVELSATQGTFTALTDITGLTLTIAPPAARRYRISTRVPLSSSAAVDILSIGILEGATVLTGAQTTNPSVNGFVTLEASKVIVADGAVHTYKVSAERASGSGNVTMQAGATQVGITYYAHLLIEDIGT